MSVRPILFRAPQVSALLEGRKTMDRQVLKPQPFPANPKLPWSLPGDLSWPIDHSTTVVSNKPFPPAEYLKTHVRYAPGDLLWVREAHYLTNDGDEEYAVYAEDLTDVEDHLETVGRMKRDTRLAGVWESHAKLRPSIHMPRWASRLTLRVTGVKVERLQDISEDDARAEGLSWVAPTYGVPGLAGSWQGSSVAAFASLWDSIHGPGSWEANPWVAAISFDVIKANIDQVKP